MSVIELRRRYRADDANALRRRLRVATTATGTVYESVRAILNDLKEDGHTTAADAVAVASWRIKQAESELERAIGKVRAT